MNPNPVVIPSPKVKCTLFETNFSSPPTNFPNPRGNFLNPRANFSNTHSNFSNPRKNFLNPHSNFSNPRKNFSNPHVNFPNPRVNFSTPHSNFPNPRANFVNPRADSVTLCPESFFPMRQKSNRAGFLPRGLDYSTNLSPPSSTLRPIPLSHSPKTCQRAWAWRSFPTDAYRPASRAFCLTRRL